MTTTREGGASGCTPGGCGRNTGTDTDEQDALLEQQALADRMAGIRHKILVMSGKGGVGKSTVAANLAVSLALAGKKVGLLDVDIHGPSIPKMLKLDGVTAGFENGAIIPVEKAGLKVMSIGFLLKNRDDAVIWRGPLKMSLIRQFLKDVAWGELDYLVIDVPPGTGDEPLSVCQLLPDAAGAVIVTTPQDVATADVRKSIAFCRQVNIPVLGVIENMSGFACPHCGETTAVFKTGGGKRMAEEMGVPFLGGIPLDPAVGEACDAGTPFIYHWNKTETAKAFERALGPILALSRPPKRHPRPKPEGESPMIIAIPLANGKLCPHFGHCEQFALLTAEGTPPAITATRLLTPPPHEPGVLPRWLHEQGATVIIAGGMGQRAQSLFAQNGITVVVGASLEAPDQLALAYLAGSLQLGANTCDH